VTRTGIIAVAFAAAAIIFAAIVTQDMRDAGFILIAYTVTAAVLAGYIWSLARRLSRARESGPMENDSTA
jgi:archaellum biogenesis protein FlaJ (TadC family)